MATPLAEQRNLAFASTSWRQEAGKGSWSGVTTEIGKISAEESKKRRWWKRLMDWGKASPMWSWAWRSLFVVSLLADPMRSLSYPKPLSPWSSARSQKDCQQRPRWFWRWVSATWQNKHTIIKTLPAAETLAQWMWSRRIKQVPWPKMKWRSKTSYCWAGIWSDGWRLCAGGRNSSKAGGRPRARHLAVVFGSWLRTNDTVVCQKEITGRSMGNQQMAPSWRCIISNLPIHTAYQELDMLPFDSDNRYMAKLVANPAGGTLAIC